jgi:predicted flap endonuclease-1-like 5' DNA nuclease
VREGDLTDIKGIGPASEQELREAGIENIQDMIDANLEELSEAVSFSKETLKKWQEDATSLPVE